MLKSKNKKQKKKKISENIKMQKQVVFFILNISNVFHCITGMATLCMACIGQKKGLLYHQNLSKATSSSIPLISSLILGFLFFFF